MVDDCDKNGNGADKVKRIQFDLTPTALRAIDELKGMAQVSTRAELIRDALRFYAWLLKTRLEGNEVLLRRGNDIEKVEFPLL